tara:strand:- start:49 stop:255 length:207 start_codon:yes stop_codon:yes gene_type:complete
VVLPVQEQQLVYLQPQQLMVVVAAVAEYGSVLGVVQVVVERDNLVIKTISPVKLEELILVVVEVLEVL